MTGSAKMRARPTRWRGVQMRSRLEAGFAQWADAEGLGPEYEPMAFAGAGGQYLPDFRLSYVEVAGVHRDHPTEGVVWVEVKPAVTTQVELERITSRMAIVLESDPDAVLAVAFKEPRRRGLIVYRPGDAWWRWAVWCRATPPYNIRIAFPLELDELPWADGYWLGPEPDEDR